MIIKLKKYLRILGQEFSKINNKQQTTDPGSLDNTEHETYHIQTAEN